jgi:lipoprotein NlpI
MYEALAKFKEAIADYDQALKLDAKLPIAWQRRGLVQFKAGNIKESIADFDKFIELEPKAKVSHWQRGISYYYAGMYKEGKEQFEGYQTFDDNDVENAVWRYLCMVPLVGKEKAQKGILKIAKDDRIPMQEVYDLFAGKAKPQDVLDAARAGKPKEDELSKRLFYAHLYLGLYYHSEGDAKQALVHLDLATTKHPIGHYMWDVARVHRDILLKK